MSDDDQLSKSYGRYSDSFDSEGDGDNQSERTLHAPKKRSPASVPTKSTKSSTKGGRATVSTTKGVHRGAGKRSDVSKRVVSARRLRYNELKNEFDIAVEKMRELELENKVLRQMQRRHERAIDQYEQSSESLPRVLQQHSAETRALRAQIKKLKDRYEDTQRKLAEREEELSKTKKKLSRLERLAEEKNLQERDTLSHELDKTRDELQSKEERCADLDKQVALLQKNHRHEIGVEMARHRETQKQLESSKEELDRLRVRLQDKEREVELRFMYTGTRKPAQSLAAPASPDVQPSPRQRMLDYERQRKPKKKDTSRSHNKHSADEDDAQHKHNGVQLESEQRPPDESPRKTRHDEEQLEREQAARDEARRRDDERRREEERRRDEERRREDDERRAEQARREQREADEKRREEDKRRKEQEELEQRRREEQERDSTQRKGSAALSEIDQLLAFKQAETEPVKATSGKPPKSKEVDRDAEKKRLLEALQQMDKEEKRPPPERRFPTPVENLHQGKPVQSKKPLIEELFGGQTDNFAENTKARPAPRQLPWDANKNTTAPSGHAAVDDLEELEL